MRVAAIQMPHGPDLAGNLATAAGMLGTARAAGARLAVLPEYFFAAPDTPPEAAGATVRAWLMRESRGGMAVAGNVIEMANGSLGNIGLVCDGGREVLAQRKAQPMPRELEGHIVGGDHFGVASLAGRPIGVLVCADILFPEAARVLQVLGAQLVLNPVLSSFVEPDPTKQAREALYVARAYDAAAFVVKAGGFRRGTSPGTGIVGRSLVAAPWGLVAHYKDEFGPEVLLADLDFGTLEKFRSAQRRFPARRPQAYRQLMGEP